MPDVNITPSVAALILTETQPSVFPLPFGQDGQREANSAALSQAGSQWGKCFVLASLLDDQLKHGYYYGADVKQFSTKMGRDDSVGTPSPPSQIQHVPGYLSVLVPLTAGSHSISISCLISDPGHWPTDTTHAANAGPFPRLTVKANPEVGLLTDVTADAVSSMNWQTITVSFTTLYTGVVELRREKRNLGMSDVVYWDNLAVT